MKGVLVLTVVGFISAVLLVTVNNYTVAPIAAAKEKAKTKALQEIFDFKFNLKNIKQVQKAETTFYEISADGKLKTIAVETSSDEGYGGKISILVGITPTCKVTGYKILSHNETPGLGDKITKEKFKQQFKDADINADWRVKKDGGFVDEITAATISSRAATNAVKKALDLVSDKYGCRGN